MKARRRASEGGSRIAARRSSQPQVLHGAASGDVQLTQLTSGQPVFELGNTQIVPQCTAHMIWSHLMFLLV